MAAAARVLFLATALAAPAAAQDVLIPREGAMRSGRLTSCVGEVCVFSGAKVPRTEIAWLGLGRTGRPPTATQTAVDEVHLAARGVIVSRVTGISLGVVATEARSLDRPDVAWIRFAGGAPGAAPTDLILRRAGGIERGELLGCAAGRCTLGGKSLTRAEIAWIGLQVSTDAPPPLGDPTRDEIHLGDGGIHPGPLVGIGAQNVVTQRDTYPRAAVAWVYLALSAEENPPGAFGAPDDDDAESEEAEPPDPPEPPTEQPPPEDEPPPTLPPPPPGSGQRGALWTGTVVGRCRGTWEGWLTEWRYRVQVRMREYRHSSPCVDATGKKRTWTYIDLEPEGSLVHNRLSMRTEEISCLGDGSVEVSTEPGAAGVGHGGGIWLNPMGCELQSIAVAGVPRGRGLYAEFVPTPHGAQFFTTCRGPDGTGTIDHGFISPTFGGGALVGQAECGDPKIRYLESDNGMMRGSYMTRCTNTCKMHVAFSICREGVRCPPPEELPAEEKEDCPPPTSQRAILDNELAHLHALVDKLISQYDRYRAVLDEAMSYQGDFELVARNCKLWDAARALMSFLVSNYAPSVPGRVVPGLQPGTTTRLQTTEPALEFANFVSWVEKVLAGDRSWVLPNIEYKGWVSMEDLWDAFQAGYGALGSSSPDALLQSLQSCSDPITHDAIYQDAVKHLRLLQQAEPLMQEVQRTLNQVRQKDIEMMKPWDDWERACREYEACRGGNPDDCAPPTPDP